MITYGKAGQFAKREAHRRLDRSIGWLGLVAIIGGLLIGVGLGVLLFPWAYHYVPFTRRVPLATYAALGLGSELVAAVVCWRLFRGLRDPLDKLARERVAILAGGQAEALVAWRLAELDERWHLFNGVAMKGGGDLDHVLVGPGGVFAISTKSHRGIYSADATGHLLHNGLPCDHAADALRRAMKLRTWLELLLQAVPEVRTVPFVQAVLVNPMTHSTVSPRQLRHVWVMDDAQLMRALLDNGRALNRATVNACVSELQRVTGLAAHAAGTKVTPTGFEPVSRP